MSLEQRQQCRLPSWLTFVGDAYYSIHLVHFPVLSAMAKLAKLFWYHHSVPYGFSFLAIVVGSLAAGCLAHVYVELPMLRYADSWFDSTKLGSRAAIFVRHGEREHGAGTQQAVIQSRTAIVHSGKYCVLKAWLHRATQHAFVDPQQPLYVTVQRSRFPPIGVVSVQTEALCKAGVLHLSDLGS